jgi:hypothetical protein
VVKPAVKSFAADLLSTGHSFVHKRMEKLLFPAMAFGAVALQRTPLLVCANESASLPNLTQFKWTVSE